MNVKQKPKTKKPVLKKFMTKTEKRSGKTIQQIAETLSITLIANHGLDDAEVIAQLTHEKIIANIKSVARNHSDGK